MDIVRETLREQGRTQVWMAERLGLNKMTLNRYLRGRRPTPPAIARRACELLGLPPSIVQHADISPDGEPHREAA